MIIYPQYISLKNWAASLPQDYPDTQFPVLRDENKWQEWAATVAATNVFQRANVPSPVVVTQGKKVNNYKTWEEWARVVYVCMMDIEVLGDPNIN